ncbi:ADP-ribosylation factor-like protein [Achlya hypogyna]|uniref:ADP-ribosylation factor-like protein n=1 Tax=Achlya hypogyna TaxID=1202772 RepID=A0A1V9YCB3_ACHHY|nr:ADP-ribosylation factor-like protein [Achlya hypogyna]
MTKRVARQQLDAEHEYLRTHVDPVLMPLIEALLLYQPTSLYAFLQQYLESGAEGLGRMKHLSDATKSAKARRQRMVDFMSSTVLPVMEDLTQRIMQSKPDDVPGFLLQVVRTRRLATGSNQIEELSGLTSLAIGHEKYAVGDAVECRFKGRPKFVPGIVEAFDAASTTYTIRYDNNKVEEHIHPILLRRPNCEPETEPKPTNAASPRQLAPVVLLLGIDGAGKSTLLSTLQGDLEKEHGPSAGYTSVKFQMANGSTTFYDLGGGPTFRSVWKEYFADAHAVIYVVDAANPGRIAEAGTVLAQTMEHPSLVGKPLLILANKRDLPSALNEKDFCRQVQAGMYNNKKVLTCVAKASANGHRVDDALETGLAWVLGRVDADYDALEKRVANDRNAKKKRDADAWQAQRLRVASFKEEKERDLMTAEDRSQHRIKAAAPASAPAASESSAIKCSNCNVKDAATKCAASKWMPVCGDCSTILKQKAAGDKKV